MHLFKHFKRKSKLQRQAKKATRLINKLLELTIVRIFIVTILLVIFIPLLLFFILRPKRQENINYGVTFSNKYAEEIGLDWKETYIAMLDDLGVRHLRLVAYWDDIEREKNIYDYEDIQWQLQEAQKRNAEVILTVGRKVPRWPECFEPTWWKSLNDTDKEKELLEYIEVTVDTLKENAAITKWQVENEPFFAFGHCYPSIKYETVKKEVEIVRNLDPYQRPILIQDSGEGGLWFTSYLLGDYLGISMYRKIWYDFWGILFGRSIYFQYPLAHWTYKLKADLVRVPYQKIIVTELQGEPWGPVINSELSEEDINETMSKHHFLDTIAYAQKAGFENLYLWGVEWWYFEKTAKDNTFYWEVAKELFKNGNEFKGMESFRNQAN